MGYSTRQKTVGSFGRPIQPAVQAFTFPASVGGVNGVDSLMMMPPQDCLYTFNLMPSEYGLRLRKGYREWATGCQEDPQRGSNTDVRTVIPFESNVQDTANDRLFAVTAEGIWGVTLFNTTEPVQEVVFPQTSDPAGYGVWTEFTGDAAGTGTRGHYLFYADGLNGIWQYEEETDLWSQPLATGGSGDDSAFPPTGSWYFDNPAVTDVTDPDYFLAFPVDNIAFVMVFKQRIWVILEDEDDAWYLPTASVSGELTKFTFGSKMAHGGNLMGLWTWTVDGGDGVDDLLVAVGRGGDVIVYQGEDPEITPDGTQIGPWSTRGSWFIGTVPNARRIVADYGPDLYILSTYGVTSLNDLLQGAPAFGQTPSAKVNRFLRADVESGKDFNSWQMAVHPGDGFLQIITPQPSQTPFVQYNLNLNTGAWGFWEGVPIFGADTWNGDYFMGGPDGVVYINDGTVDGTELTKANHWQDINPVAGPEWSKPDVDEYSCDGSQVAETRYTTDSAFTLIIGETYQVFYRMKPNAPTINYFDGTPSGAIPPEWTTLVPEEYKCDGTQVAETAYPTTVSNPLKVGVRYEIFYEVKESAGGNHRMATDVGDTSPFVTGDGQFSYTFTPTIETSGVDLVGDVDFEGIFFNVVVAFFDGSGSHHMEVGVGDFPVTVTNTGSGAFAGVFTAAEEYTTISLVGGPLFTGTFFEVSLSVQSNSGDSISFRTLTSFQAPQGHANFTQVGLIRSTGVLAGVAEMSIRAVYDYAIETQLPPPVALPTSGESVWDSALWDIALWDFGVEGKSIVEGSLGLGRTFAVALNGNATTRINIISWDCLFVSGGLL